MKKFGKDKCYHTSMNSAHKDFCFLKLKTLLEKGDLFRNHIVISSDKKFGIKLLQLFMIHELMIYACPRYDSSRQLRM